MVNRCPQPNLNVSNVKQELQMITHVHLEVTDTTVKSKAVCLMGHYKLYYGLQLGMAQELPKQIYFTFEGNTILHQLQYNRDRSIVFQSIKGKRVGLCGSRIRSKLISGLHNNYLNETHWQSHGRTFRRITISSQLPLMLGNGDSCESIFQRFATTFGIGPKLGFKSRTP